MKQKLLLGLFFVLYFRCLRVLGICDVLVCHLEDVCGLC